MKINCDLLIIAVIVALVIVSRLYSAIIKGYIGELKVNLRLKLLGCQFILVHNLLFAKMPYGINDKAFLDISSFISCFFS